MILFKLYYFSFGTKYFINFENNCLLKLEENLYEYENLNKLKMDILL